MLRIHNIIVVIDKLVDLCNENLSECSLCNISGEQVIFGRICGYGPLWSLGHPQVFFQAKFSDLDSVEMSNEPLHDSSGDQLLPNVAPGSITKVNRFFKFGPILVFLKLS